MQINDRVSQTAAAPTALYTDNALNGAFEWPSTRHAYTVLIQDEYTDGLCVMKIYGDKFDKLSFMKPIYLIWIFEEQHLVQRFSKEGMEPIVSMNIRLGIT